MSNSWAHRLLPTTCFTASRLTATTFKIVEDDRFHELPFIYIKIYPTVILLIDTGCGGAARDPTVQLKSLRQFIERFPIVDNGSRPLNEGGLKPYIVVQTHLHYDHICGMEQFIGSTIVASNYSKLFVTCDLPTHSLCRFLNLTTPKYDVTQWGSDCDYLFSQELNLQIQVLHTPGHTPDSLALWDEEDKVLFVGDTLYEWAPTIFPNEGDIVDWLGSMDKLLAFVKEKISIMPAPHPVSINCGHVTACGPALEILDQMHDFMEQILSGKIPITQETVKRDEKFVTYGTQGVDRFVVACPERLVKEAREQLDI